MKNKHEYLGRSVLYRRMGELDMGIVNATKGDGLKIISCTTQKIHVIHDEPLLLDRLGKLFDFLRGKEEPCKDLIDHVELIKYKAAYNAQADLIASLVDTIDNTLEQQMPERKALINMKVMIDGNRESCYVKDDQPF